MVNQKIEISEFDSITPIEKKIIDAFMSIYADKPIEKISIKMITNRAGLNRSTFYLHYTDIYDLLEIIESKYHKISQAIASNAVKAMYQNELLADALPEIEFYESNIAHLKILLCVPGKSNLDQIMRSELKKAITFTLENKALWNHELNEYALEYITSAQVATIIHWIQNDMRIPLYKISNLIQVLAVNGALTYFESQKGK